MSGGGTIAMAAVLALGFATAAEAQDSPAGSREDDWRRCRTGDADISLSGCRAIIQAGQETPGDLAKALDLRGRAYRAKRMFDLSLEDFSEAIRLNPDFIDAYGDRGITLTALGRFMDAIPDFTRVVDAEPRSAYAVYDRALCYEALGLDDLAIEDFSAAIALVPNEAIKWERRGTVYFRKGQHDLALADYEKALVADPQYAPALYGRGAIKMKRGDLAGGGADLAQAKYFQDDIDRQMARYGVRP